MNVGNPVIDFSSIFEGRRDLNPPTINKKLKELFILQEGAVIDQKGVSEANIFETKRSV